MSEGTKIGDYGDNAEFNATVQTTGEGESNKATKLGSVSDFEKSLVDNEPQTSGSEDDSSEPQEITMESFFQDELENPIAKYNEGDIIRGSIRSIEKGGVLIDISYKSDGFIFNNELDEDEVLEEGNDLLVYIESLESKEGYTILSRKKALIEETWNNIIDLSKSKGSLRVKGVSQVQGGVVVSYKGVRGFVPASQIAKDKSEEFSQFVGKSFDAVVLQADRRRKKVIFSHKQAANKLQKDQSSKILETLEVGQIKEGVVTSIKDFGVFVEIEGIEGLVHISELSWSRVSHPSDIVTVGSDVKVFVLGVDKENQRISLGMKQLEPDPWVEVSNKYTVGQVVTGCISRVAPFGAFINIENNLEGLIHISELSFEHIKQVEDVINVGDEVEARIIKLVPEEQKIGLSLKGVHDEVAETSSDDTAEFKEEETTSDANSEEA
jgi:small subunit ribosomal protein S1